MKRTTRKKVFLGIIAVLVALQFFQPPHNQQAQASADAIEQHFTVPEQVQQLLQQSCNDCHSNNTKYPWYSRIQPLGWWLNHHIEEGKEHLNFDEFARYSVKKQKHKLEEIIETVSEGEMPLKSYTLIHGEAKLSAAQQQVLISWAKTLQQQL